MKKLDELYEQANQLGLCINLKFSGETAYINGNMSYENQTHIIKHVKNNKILAELNSQEEVEAFISGFVRGKMYP